MGNKNSHQPAAPPVCENCHKSTQKPLPSTNTSNHDDANNGDDKDSQIRCMEQYEQVEDCMKQNKGQIVPCSNAWQIFKQCREQTTTTRVWSYYCTFDYILCDRNWNKKSAYWHKCSTASQDRENIKIRLPGTKVSQAKTFDSPCLFWFACVAWIRTKQSGTCYRRPNIQHLLLYTFARIGLSAFHIVKIVHLSYCYHSTVVL